MNPLQFQKWMRLHEARRLMLMGQLDATSAALQVDYESTSQFSRENSSEHRCYAILKCCSKAMPDMGLWDTAALDLTLNGYIINHVMHKYYEDVTEINCLISSIVYGGFLV